MSSSIRVPKGLEGVVVTSTSLTKIDGLAGRLLYRGYDVTELAGNIPYEAVASLLWEGHLPNQTELSKLQAKMAASRALPEPVSRILQSISKATTPLSALETTVSLLGGLEKAEHPILDASIILTARMPTIVASYYRIRQGKRPLPPKPEFGHTANFLYLLTDHPPRPEHIHALDSYFTLLADHGLGASTFAARVAASTLTDVYSAIVAAIATLKGPLHGGAPSQVWDMLQDIGKPEQAEAWLRERLDRGDRVMGFGHRVYRTEDPRSKVLKRLAQQIADPALFRLASTVEEKARQMLREAHPDRPLDTNVEFYSSLVLHAVGIPPELFTCCFASARTAGWTAHIIEQLKDNRLFRPTAEYVGPEGLTISAPQK